MNEYHDTICQYLQNGSDCDCGLFDAESYDIDLVLEGVNVSDCGCGFKSPLLCKSTDYRYFVFCLGCTMETNDFASRTQAITAWNTRHTQEPQP